MEFIIEKKFKPPIK